MAHAGPRSEHEHHAGVAHGPDRVPLARLEVRDKAGSARNRAPILGHFDLAVCDHQVGAFVDLVFL